jgi:diguanylate cyclase (GGDEF)-like protein
MDPSIIQKEPDTIPVAIEDKVRALCVAFPSAEAEPISRFLGERGVVCRMTASCDAAERLLLESHWDLVVIDVDRAPGDVAAFLSFCRSRHLGLPIVALHEGALGSRGASLIRMGAFDAFPRDLDRWNSLVFLERALSQARIVKQLLHLSRTDHLTGLYNQRFLYESLEKEMLRGRRLTRTLTVALLDMDGFKAFNDAHGHLEGDIALAQVGRALTRSIRGGQDTAFRYGGDEFLLLLPETTVPEASVVLERVRETVHSECRRPVTFSIGITRGEDHADVPALMRAVDGAMYAAKESGGDRIHVHFRS